MTFATGATSGEIERRQKRLCVKVGHESTAAVTRLDYAENGQRAQRFPLGLAGCSKRFLSIRVREATGRQISGFLS